MDTPSTVLTLLFACVGCFALVRPRSNIMGYVKDLVHKVEVGICPSCESIHPEATKHTGSSGFWTVFRCPDCGHSVTTHRADLD